jgi:hypothetical protein
MGITYESVGESEITIGASPDGVSLAANRDGLRSLVHLLENLLGAPSADHIHLTPSMQLAPDSESLVVSCTEPGAPHEGLPADWDQMSLDARRIWRLEAQLLRAESSSLPVPAPTPTPAHHTWVWEENVRTLVESISRWVDYTFDDSDWTAIAEGLKTSDADEDRWYSYPVIGASRVDIDLARNAGAAPVNVRIILDPLAPPGLAAKVGVLLELLNVVRVQADRGLRDQ